MGRACHNMSNQSQAPQSVSVYAAHYIRARSPTMSLVNRIKETDDPKGQDWGPVWRTCPLVTMGNNGHKEDAVSS